MKQITFLTIILVLITTGLKAQVKYTVLTAGNTFSPNNITINVGDTVEWTNTGGTHNVNGTQATFPSNPVSFGNSVGGAPWTYTFVFNTSGTYAYRCDIHFSMGMAGIVTVNNTTGVNSYSKNDNDFEIYPNPASGYVRLINAEKFDFIEVVNLKGETVFETTTKGESINVSNLSAGLYIIKAKNNHQVVYKKLIIN